MSGIWTLFLLIFSATLPVGIAFLYLRSQNPPLAAVWFLAALAAGGVSLIAAALAQRFFPFSVSANIGSIFFSVFIRISLVEEASRVFTLAFLRKAALKLKAAPEDQEESFGALLGLSAGLGFAAAETAFYSTANLGITLLRALTAAPLHGACGSRIGAAVFGRTENPARAFFYCLSAVFIHGAYNLMIVSPALPEFLPLRAALVILFAFAVLFTAPFRKGK